MKAKMLEYNIMKSQKMSVLHVSVYLRMMPIQLSGLNVPMNTVEYGLMQSVWRCVIMPMYVYMYIACEALLV